MGGSNAGQIEAAEESYNDRIQRIRAARVLTSHEQLVWHSMARNEVCRLDAARSTILNGLTGPKSIEQTRRHFRALMAGWTSARPKQDASVDFTPLPDAYTCSTDKKPEPASASKDGRKAKRKSDVA